MRPRLKICGLTRAEDVGAAARWGADALGFVFAAGPRQLTPYRARDLAAVAPPWLNRVGVFGPDQKREAPAIAEACRLDTLQLHGAPDAAFCAYHRGRFTIIQALGVPDVSGEEGQAAQRVLQAAIAAIAPYVDGLLLDTAVAGQLGGTGRVFDWQVLGALDIPVPVIVAGGLDPDNVAALLAAYQPWGLDVSSGVEAAPGIKDEAKIAALSRLLKTI